VSHCLGVDFGGVIVEAAAADTSRLPCGGYSPVRPVSGATAALAEMARLFEGRVWVISKASPGTERWTGSWLASHAFYEATRIPVEHVLFVRESSGKRDACERIGIIHYVDDRLKILRLLTGAVEHLYLFGDPTGAAFEFTSVSGWDDLRGELVRSVE
jgi:hypothetical protein